MKCYASMLTLAALFFVALSVVPYASAYCHHGRAKLNDDFEVVCDIKVEGIELHAGEHELTDDCVNCTCTVNGFSCCGVGVNAGVGPDVPEGYQMVVFDNCTGTLVPIHQEHGSSAEASSEGHSSAEDNSLGDRSVGDEEDLSWEDVLGDRSATSHEDLSWEDVLGYKRRR